MSLSKKLLLLIIFIICLWILYTLFERKNAILRKIELQKTKRLQEGFDSSDPDYNYILSEVQKLSTVPPFTHSSQITNISKNMYNLPLKQFCIKGSYNSAYSGKYVSDIMVQYVLSRGCRFLDFELYYNTDVTDAVVGYSQRPLDPKSSYAVTPSISNTNPYLFSTMLKNVIQNAFTSQMQNGFITPNPNDPLFIQIRMKTSYDMYETLYDCIKSAINQVEQLGNLPFFYNGKVDGTTPVSRIMKKIIIVFENNTYIPELNPGSNYCNMVSDTHNLYKNTYSQLDPAQFIANPPKMVTSTTVTTNRGDMKFQILDPEPNTTSQPNPNLFSSIKNYGIQVAMYQFNVQDEPLTEYEMLFNTYQTSFVPMSYCLTYINNYMANQTNAYISPLTF